MTTSTDPGIREGRAQDRSSVVGRWLRSLSFLDRALAGMLAASVGALLAVCVAWAQSTAAVARLDHRAEYALGGRNDWWHTIVAGLGFLPLLTAMLLVAATLGLVWRRTRRRCGVALIVIAGANVTSQAIKRVTGSGFDHPATLPSGHVTLGLSCAVAVIFLLNGRWRVGAAGVCAVIGTWSTLGVVAAYWHRPLDVVAAAAVVLGWLAAAMCFLPPSVGWHRVWNAWRAIRLLPVLAGAAAVPAAFCSEGLLVKDTDTGTAILGHVLLVGLPVLAAVVVLVAWRAAELGTRPRTTLGGC